MVQVQMPATSSAFKAFTRAVKSLSLDIRKVRLQVIETVEEEGINLCVLTNSWTSIIRLLWDRFSQAPPDR